MITCVEIENDIIKNNLITSNWNSNEYFYNTFEYVKNSGLWLEFGVATGRTINIISSRTTNKVYGFDTFQGLPEDWEDHQGKGVYSQDGVLPKDNTNVELIVGLFQDTLEEFLDEHPEPIAYLHIDADLYSSTKYVFDNIEDRIVPGTVISFDEVYNNQVYLDHEMKAWVEFANKTEIRYNWITRTPHEQASLIIK